MVCLNSKVYIADHRTTNQERKVIKQACKGLQRSTNPLTLAEYRNVLDTGRGWTGTNHGFRLKNGQLVYYSQQRQALTYFYCKRIVHSDGVTTSPLKIW